MNYNATGLYPAVTPVYYDQEFLHSNENFNYFSCNNITFDVYFSYGEGSPEWDDYAGMGSLHTGNCFS